MAQNYTQFSEVVCLSTDPAQREIEIKFIKDEIDLLKQELIKEDEYADVAFSYDFDEDGFWVCAEEYVDLDQVAAVVQNYLAKFHPNGIWTLTYAESCSKMRIGEFGGGAMIVTANDVKYWSAYEECQKAIKNHNGNCINGGV